MKKRIVVTMAVLVVLALAGCLSTKTQTTQTNPTVTLVEAAKIGTPQDVQAAIDSGADVNAISGDLTPLMWAAGINPNPEVITTLLKAGANIEARDTRIGILGTAVGWAAYRNPNPEVIATLIKAGAEIDASTEEGRTGLSWAAQFNTPEVIIVLLNAGADAKVKDKYGFTAFHYAKYNEILKGTDALKKLEEASQ